MNVVVTREQQYKSALRNERFQWKWLYSYSIDGAAPVTYGTHLASLRDMLRQKARRSGQQAVITEAWKTDCDHAESLHGRCTRCGSG